MGNQQINKERADHAHKALRVFASEVDEVDFDTEVKGDQEGYIIDLICNLMHYAKLNYMQPEQLVKSAREHFVMEA